MCARYSLTKEGISILIGEIEIILSIGARYNIAPKQNIPVIFNNGGKIQEKEMSWGWNTNFSDQPLINAKSETISSLPTFKPYLHQRCLIPADGFYEWTKDKTPIRFMRRHDEPFCFAGLWRVTQRKPYDVEIDVFSVVILTRPPVAPVTQFHNRMPFVVEPHNYDNWLKNDFAMEWTLKNPDETPFDFVPVQRELNNVRNEGAHLIKRGLLQGDLL